MKQKSPNPFLRVAMAATALALAGSASAATITWQGPQAISSSTEISTQGTQVFGLCPGLAYGNPAAVVNGVNFGYNNPSWAVTYSESMGNITQFNPGVPTVGGPDASNYQSVLNFARESNTTSATITLGNLTLNQEYLFQFWVADYRIFGIDFGRYETLTLDGNTSGQLSYLRNTNTAGSASGSYIIGTFTADSTSATFTLNAGAGVGGGDAMYNAMQLRAIPEPSAALLGGLGMLALLRRRRSL